jgi:hypothetical protein
MQRTPGNCSPYLKMEREDAFQLAVNSSIYGKVFTTGTV